eukprot:12894316-Prorocentrum_lima.AAC.1
MQRSRPSLCMWENVEGIATGTGHGPGSDLKGMRDIFKQLGYATQPLSTCATSFGLLQHRAH